jgi:hypothetical protein
MRPFLEHKDGETYRVEDVVARKIEEEKEVEIDGKKQKQKTTRLGVFTKAGRELIDPHAPPPPPPAKTATPVVPGFDPLKLPPELRPGTPGPAPTIPPELPKEEPKKAPDAAN